MIRFGRRKKIGLALGGGAARGWSHLGVLRALEEKNIQIDCIAGTSIGALVGGFMAAGKIRELEELALNLDWKKVLYYFFEPSFPRAGLVDGKKMVDVFRQNMKKSDFKSLVIPFRAVATDIITGREVVMGEGDLIEAIRASISLPGIFAPVRRGKEMLVDGGLVNPLPVSVVREMGADYVIAVDLNHDVIGRQHIKVKPRKAEPLPEPAIQNPILKSLNDKMKGLDLKFLKPAKEWMARDGGPTIFDILGNTVLIAETQITETRLKVEKPDVLIRPDVAQIAFLEFFRAREAMELGYRAAMEQIKL